MKKGPGGMDMSKFDDLIEMTFRSGRDRERHFAILRVKLSKQLLKWGVFASYAEMANLFNYPTPEVMKSNWTEKNSRQAQRLLGPHGFALYKAMKARQLTSTDVSVLSSPPQPSVDQNCGGAAND